MLKTFRLKALALAAATCVALAAAGPANAYVYAVSHLDIQDLVIPFGGLTGASVNSYTFTVQNTASLNGVPATGFLNNNCNGTDTTTTCGTSLLLPTLDSDPASCTTVVTQSHQQCLYLLREGVSQQLFGVLFSLLSRRRNWRKGFLPLSN